MSLLVALTGLSTASPAQAADVLTEKSAGRKFTLESKAASDKAGRPICVAAETEDAGNQNGKLRARTDCADAGAWETFTLHTDDKGAHTALRSEAEGLYVSAEFHDAGTHFGMLRARQDGGIGAWERFELVPQAGGYYALRYTFSEGGAKTSYYVSAEIDDSGQDEGLLRARETGTPGSWELFKLHEVTSNTNPPAAASTPQRGIHALTWNTCSNNDGCGMYIMSVDEFTYAVSQRAVDADADVIFFQEFCEKLAKPLEQKLEARFDGGADAWDVRFAPIQYQIGSTDEWAQKDCARNRGAYGVAVAVPAENTWYKAIELESPVPRDKEKFERRTALCAAVRSWAVMACSAHFSTGGATYDDPTREVQAAQAADLARRVAGYGGYRPVFGGDLNATPTVTVVNSDVPVLKPLYDSYKECDQPGNRPTKGTNKLDYLFAAGSATWSGCTIGSAVANPSDHQPLWGTVTLPAR
ncbi:endonuclease/exonuclease/phosphatase family protein [Streptomyces sp. NPDC049813]|uniref:endonuclease/exonuclease/phosphatase family protein n=1 Tax=Streptomyces sp. NPDC049813 TaxID=3365597 RepID=UPI0037B1C973